MAQLLVETDHSALVEHGQCGRPRRALSLVLEVVDERVVMGDQRAIGGVAHDGREVRTRYIESFARGVLHGFFIGLQVRDVLLDDRGEDLQLVGLSVVLTHQVQAGGEKSVDLEHLVHELRVQALFQRHLGLLLLRAERLHLLVKYGGPLFGVTLEGGNAAVHSRDPGVLRNA